MSVGNGFALEEYVVPRNPNTSEPMGGTIPKASNAHGSLFSEVARSANQVPGPEQYHKDFLNKPFTQKARGGKFSKLTRDWGKHPPMPSVGQYETTSPLTTPRTRGGPVSKTPRGCYFLDRAMRQAKASPAPGKYEDAGAKLTPRAPSPRFSTPRTESRNPQKPSPVGPGYYDPSYAPTEDRVIAFTSPREATRSFLEKAAKVQAKTPAPGEHGIPESKAEDVVGRRKHMARLLADRIISPRVRPPPLR